MINFEIIKQLQDLNQVIALRALLSESKTEYSRNRITNKLAVIAFPEDYDDYDPTKHTLEDLF